MTREEALKSVARTFLQAAYPDLTVEELEQKQCAFVDKALHRGEWRDEVSNE